MSIQYIALIFLFIWGCNATSSTNTTSSTTSDSATTITEPTTDVPKEKTTDTPKTVDEPPTNTTTKEQKKATVVDLGSFQQPDASQFDAEYLMGKFDPAKHPDFTTINTNYASRGGMLLRKDAYQAFILMHEAAKKDDISLKIISATRPFHHQKRIWEGKWNGERKVDGVYLPADVRDPEHRAYKILRWSSMPGTSRHHWGTDIDLNDLNNSYFESGSGKKVYDWLLANAATYGFCQPYTVKDQNRLYGYEEEKWHWSYIPVAEVLTALYDKTIDNEDITGFEGSQTAVTIDIKAKYVLGINQDCK